MNMRDLTATRNTAVITDSISGDTHEVYYRRPTNREMVGFQNNAFKRKGNRIENRLFETRLLYGSKIVTGFRKGTLGCHGKPIASDPNDPDYREDWLQLIVDHAPDVVAVVAMIAFEGTTASRNDEFEEEPPCPDPLEE